MAHRALQDIIESIRELDYYRRSVFRTQMRAILRAAAHGPVRMMWPMITSISEVLQCLIHLDTAQRQLTERGSMFLFAYLT